MKPTAYSLLLLICISLASQLQGEKKPITFQPDRVLDSSRETTGRIERDWNKIEKEKKERIEGLLFVQLGLSATGHIEAIGSYRLIQSSDFGKVDDQVFHFIQKDIFGHRLVWSCLVNSDSMKYKMIYQADDYEQFKDVKPINHNQSIEEQPIQPPRD